MTVEKDMYDDAALAKMREEQEDPWVQYIIINQDLNMGCGKIPAQVGHGCGMHILKYNELWHVLENNIYNISEKNEKKIKDSRSWIEQSFRKIVKVAHQKEFDKIQLLEEIDCFAVRDAGLTEVAAGSVTVLVLWPILRSNCPKIIHRLQNLK